MANLPRFRGGSSQSAIWLMTPSIGVLPTIGDLPGVRELRSWKWPPEPPLGWFYLIYLDDP